MEIDEDVWEERTEVRNEILEMIAEHTERKKRPPFSAQELQVMALLCSCDRSVSFAGALHWVVRTFSYYRERALLAYAESVPYLDYDERPMTFIPDWYSGWNDWSAPFVQLESRSPAKHTNASHDCGYSVPLAAGRMYLRKWLEPERQGHLPFLKLPSEVRNSIYELVFTLPASGLALLRGADYDTNIGGRSEPVLHTLAFYLQQRPEDAKSDLEEWHYSLNFLLCPPLSQILALLAVNKEIRAEAKTYFYELNHFYFDTFESFSAFVNNTSSEYLVRLGHIHLRMHHRHQIVSRSKHSDHAE